jgi:hypothetical protein
MLSRTEQANRRPDFVLATLRWLSPKDPDPPRRCAATLLVEKRPLACRYLSYVRSKHFIYGPHSGGTSDAIQAREALLPKNGEINKEFGIYKSLCCGAEIVIPENVTFPDCAVHMNLPTEWKNITNTDHIPHVRNLDPKKRKNSAA